MQWYPQKFEQRKDLQNLASSVALLEAPVINVLEFCNGSYETVELCANGEAFLIK